MSTGDVGGKTWYSEDIFVGYRYYDTKQIPVAFPFGHGLSYTDFVYANLNCQYRSQAKTWRLEWEISNTGQVDGTEIAQVYVRPLSKSKIRRPFQELRGYQVCAIAAGSSSTIQCFLDKSAFAYFDPGKGKWVAEAAQWDIRVGASSRDIRLQKVIETTFVEEWL